MPDHNDSADTIIRAKVIVDAAGQQGLMSGRTAARNPSRDMKKVAIWGHFRGARREIIDDGVMTLVLRTHSNECWFWHIPLSNDIVSVGVVGDASYLLQGRGTPDEIFAEEVADCPSVAERLAGAEQAAELAVVKEYSYSTERAAGDGWVFVGDSWGFIDPLYSSGVLFALKSASSPPIASSKASAPATHPPPSSANGFPTSPSPRAGSANSSSPFTPASSASAASSANTRSIKAT